MRQAIESREYFVILIAPTTLSSKVVCEELQWASEASKKIIPIWHGGFDLNNKEHVPEDISVHIREIITGINAIQINGEDPYQYEIAIEKLLSIFH